MTSGSIPTAQVPVSASFQQIAARLSSLMIDSDWTSSTKTISSSARAEDALRYFGTLLEWFAAVGVSITIGERRSHDVRNLGATAALLDTRRVGSALKALAEHGGSSTDAHMEAVAELSSVHG